MDQNNSYTEKRIQEANERIDKKFETYKDQPIMQHIAQLAKNYLENRIKATDS